jgi:hypothetical protein
VRINVDTGALAAPGDKNAIWESFIPGTEPQEGQARPILDGSVTGSASNGPNAIMNMINGGGAAAPADASGNPVPGGPAQPDNSGSMVRGAGGAAQPDDIHSMVRGAPAAPAAPSSPATVGTGGLY